MGKNKIYKHCCIEKYNSLSCKIFLASICIFFMLLWQPLVVANNTQKSLTSPSSHTSKKMSFDFQDAPITSLLQLIAKASNSNLVVSDKVQGKMSLNLQDVTWQEALDIILKAHGLGYQKIGNTLLVAPIDDITNNQLKEMQAKQRLEELEPLTYKIVSLKYANAKETADTLKSNNSSLLSARGQVGIDPRTNSLVINDTAKNVKQVVGFVNKLDTPAKQVLIQARIVNMDTTFEREIGVRFGISSPRHLSGKLAGANELARGVPIQNVPISDRLNFDVPATTLFQNPGSVGLALAKLGNTYLDLELSAMESEGMLKIVSSPKIITSNQKTATIHQGEEIPYLEASSSGAATVSFKNALLALEVTPQITPNHKIMLNLKVTENKRGIQSNDATTLSPPAIDSQEVESNVLLNNGESIVIGGIYRQLNEKGVDRIPFLGSIPVIGVLFRHNVVRQQKRELLVFITPTIMK